MNSERDKRAHWLCMAALCAGSASASAQSSVTLYGVLDEGINYTNNVGGHSQVAMASGFPHGSRWGLKGNEDLGGGATAIFQLENGFDVDNGRAFQGGALFGRQRNLLILPDSEHLALPCQCRLPLKFQLQQYHHQLAASLRPLGRTALRFHRADALPEDRVQ